MPYTTALQQNVISYGNALLLERVNPNTGCDETLEVQLRRDETLDDQL